MAVRKSSSDHQGFEAKALTVAGWNTPIPSGTSAAFFVNFI
jgi:hypothetical protein